jgi:phosphoenolpyruvate carboxykinase (GTP)
MPENGPLTQWIDEISRLTQPDRVHWCDGSQEERDLLVAEMVRTGILMPLNPRTHPESYLHRSHHSDVARTEQSTFICTQKKEDAGPTNNWMSPADAKEKLGKLYQGCMKGRTLFVIPYIMGPVGSPFSRVGVEVTDSPYVVVSMRVMTRMGKVALDRLGTSGDFVRGLHSLGDLNPERRFICHFPEERTIWSVGSGYGGNALLGKKCHALRIASWIGRQEGWLAEHMLILGLQDPQGETTYIAAAFPSACGKTNLAMLVPPAEFPGWKVWTVGDDIAWMHPGPDGRLWAINPEAGFFGVVPGTSAKTNPNAMAMLNRDVIFTNVAVTPDGQPWWEGSEIPAPTGLVDWQGRASLVGRDKAAHPNSRFTVAAKACPSIAPNWEEPKGVPISAFVFGGRRARVAPLVYEALNWTHGVFVGAGMASETTAAATGAVGVVRRDPMAMLPFCGYNMADYWKHWLSVGAKLKQPPRIFHVNWFRTGADGKFLWPGFGQNLRVLRWVVDRVKGTGKAVESPIGLLPGPDALDGRSLNVAWDQLMSVDRAQWQQELKDQRAFFQQFGDRLPQELLREHEALASRLH